MIKKEAKQKIRDKEKNYKTCQILLKIKVSAFIVCSVHILKHIYEPHSVAVSRSSLNKGIKVKYCQRVCKKRGEKNAEFEEIVCGYYQETKSCSAKSSHWVNVNFRFCVFQFTSLSFQYLFIYAKYL